MRLTKSAKLILGMTAGGGLALILSGGAFAADNVVSVPTTTPLKTVSQTAGSTTTVVSASTISTNNTGTSSTVVGPSSGSVPPANTDGGAVNLANPDVASPSKSATNNLVAAPVPSSNDPVLSGIQPTTTTSDDIATPLTAPTMSASSGDSSSNSEAPVLSRNDVEPQISEASVVSSIVFHSALLAVQPKITSSRPAVIDDLATMMPSAPVQQQSPAKAPAPTQPAGLLTRLTVGLAGVVVPRAALPAMLGAIDFFARLMIILTSLILAVGFVTVSFGGWLRRSGYVHAARSDVAESSFFATSFLMGYAPAFGHHITHFLMVSDMKIARSIACNAFRKEEMR